MEEIQESTEEVVRDYKTKRKHGRTAATKSGYVRLEYQGRVIAKRRYCNTSHRKDIVLGWRHEYKDIGSMVLIIEPDNVV